MIAEFIKLEEENQPERYHVVFEYTEEAKGYSGVRFSRIFPDKQSFEEIISDNKEHTTVIAQGLSSELTTKIAQETPLLSYLLASAQDSMLNGIFNDGILEMNVAAKLSAKGLRNDPDAISQAADFAKKAYTEKFLQTK